MPTLLFVCTGNLCRSPLMQYLLSNRAIEGLTVRSAGTWARDGDPMHPNALAVLAERGINADEFRTTALNEAVLEDVDTVVGASREHRAAAVTLRPALLKKSFTLAELSRTTGLFADDEMPRDGDLPARLEGLVSVAARRRGLSLPNDPADDDLADPLDQPVDAFEACARQIDAYLDPVVRALLG